MNHSAADVSHADAPGAARRRLRFELIFASVWLGLGLFILPAMIYMVGMLLLGPYGTGAGLGRFYLDFFGDLAQPAGRAWALALGPLLLITALRLVFLGAGKDPEDAAATHKSPPRPAADHARIEPHIDPDQ